MGRIGGLGAGMGMAASQCLNLSTYSMLQQCSKIGRNKNSAGLVLTV
jgi:hypothetical protein